MGNVGVASGFPVAAVPEQHADQAKVLARHDGLARGRMTHAMQPHPVRLRVGAGRAPAGDNAVGAPAFGMAREPESMGIVVSGQSIDRCPCGFAERHRAPASLEVGQVYCVGLDPGQCRLHTSLWRQSVSASSRNAATASGRRASYAWSARPSQASSSVSRKWASCFLKFFAIPRQGMFPRSQNSHSSARHIIECRISRVQCPAPIQFLLALSSPVATPSEPVRSRGILPNAGTMRASRLMRMVLRSEGFQCGSQLRMYSAANSRKVGVCVSCRMSSSGFTPAQMHP